VQVEHVSRVGLATGGPFQDEGDLAVGDSVLREVVVNDQGIHPVFHEPLAHGRAGVRGEVLIGGVVGRGGRDNDGVFERARGLKGGQGADDVGVLLPDGDVDGIDRAELRITARKADLVDLCLVDDGVDRDGGLAGAAVADDQFALAAADRDHGVDRHDTGEKRLGDGLPDDDPGGDLLDGEKLLGRDRTLSVDGIAEGVDRAAEEGLADRHREETAGGLDLVALLQFGDIAEDDAADLVLLEIERDADRASRELDHLVVHDLGETFDLRDAIGDRADHTGVLLDALAGELGDLLFNLFEDGAHRKEGGGGLKSRGSDGAGELLELAGDGGFVDVVTDAHAHAGDQGVVASGGAGDAAAVAACHRGGDRLEHSRSEGTRVVDHGAAASDLGGNQALVGTEHRDGVGRAVLFDIGEHTGDALGRDFTVDHAQPEKLSGELLDLFPGGCHGAVRVSVGARSQTPDSSRAAASL